MDAYEEERSALLNLNDQGQPWSDIAGVLGHSKALWWQIAKGKVDPTYEQCQSIREHCGLPPRPLPPAEAVVKAGIKSVVHAHEEPDTALLIKTEHLAVERVTVTVKPGEPITRSAPVTQVKRKRKPRKKKRSSIVIEKSLRERLDRTRYPGMTWDEWAEHAAEILENGRAATDNM